MTDFRIDSRMKVKTLKTNFKKKFGATLCVYATGNCKAMAGGEATTGSLMASSAKGGVLTVDGNLGVGNFGKKIVELYGVGTQVANTKNTELSSSNIALITTGKK